jgi:hypothetical protein
MHASGATPTNAAQFWRAARSRGQQSHTCRGLTTTSARPAAVSAAPSVTPEPSLRAGSFSRWSSPSLVSLRATLRNGSMNREASSRRCVTTASRTACDGRSLTGPGSRVHLGEPKAKPVCLTTGWASWRSRNAFSRAPRTSGFRRPSNSDSGSNNCSFPTELRSTEKALLEPAQPHRPSATCGKSEPEMKVWWT